MTDGHMIANFGRLSIRADDQVLNVRVPPNADALDVAAHD